LKLISTFCHIFHSPPNYDFSGLSISQNNATMGLSIFSAVALFWLLSNVFWWTLFTSGFFVSIHAVLRDASMHQDGEDQMDMVGEFSGGEHASFLGQDPV
jgi:hypothetical protein